jgi:hypothetical protein
MADAQTCEVGVTLAPLNIRPEMTNGNRSSENMQLLLRKLVVKCKTTTWWLQESITNSDRAGFDRMTICARV